MQTEKYSPPPILRGEDSPSAILTENNVRLIRSLRGRERGIVLAQRFGVSPATISAIQVGRIWKHLL